MKLSTAERKLLKALAFLANKLTGSGVKATSAKLGGGGRAGRSRAESEKLKTDILAAVKKGKPVSEISKTMGVTSPYVYQLMKRAGVKRRKSK